MAKKKNSLKTGLKSLRQALSTVKTAIIHFSDDHIVAIGYNPTSKETIVSDIPQNISSQFILGEGGGGSSITPVVEITVINNSSTDAMLSDQPYIRDDKYYKEAPTVSAGATAVVKAVALIMDYGDFQDAGVGLIVSHENVTISNTVNCTIDENFALVTDFSSNASLTLTLGD